MNDVTGILVAIERGDPKAASQLLPLVYDELRKLAAARSWRTKPPGRRSMPRPWCMRPTCGSSARRPTCTFANCKHFFVAASEAMRRILVDNARRKGRAKRGGHLRRVELEGDALEAPRAQRTTDRHG